MPRRSARRANGKNVVEEPYGHPVVVVLKPAEESHMVSKNPANPDMRRLHFDRWFKTRLSVENLVLNKEEPNPQHQSHVSAGSTEVQVELKPEHMEPTLYRSVSDPTFSLTHAAQEVDARRYTVPETALRRSYNHPWAFNRPRSDFGVVILSRAEMVSSNAEAKTVARNFSWDIWQPIDRVLKRIAAEFEGKTTSRKDVGRRLMTKFWVNAKGVMAVAIASV